MSRVLVVLIFLAACRAPFGDGAAHTESPPAKPRELPPDIAESVTRLDAALAASQVGLEPAPLTDDHNFLRRVYLDLTGTLPPPEAVKSFAAAAEPAEKKRAELVQKLVASPAFARHFTNYWDAVLMDGARGAYIDRAAFRQWLYGELEKKSGWDDMVYRLLTASGVNSEGGRRDAAKWEPAAAANSDVNGAVNWLLRGAREPQNLAGAASRIFLGVQIQCAECHDHPTEKWKQEDFKRFTAAFMRVGGERLDQGRKMGMRRLSVDDVEEPTRRMERRMQRTGYDDANPRALDGTSLAGDKPREKLAAWMTSPKNPWFARALVNRLWASLLGSGFVEPVDDFRSDSQVRAPAVFDALAADFVAHDFDLRRLVRVICATEAYQRSPGDAAKLWESFRLRPMNADQLLDSLVAASGIEPILEDTVGERLPQMKFRMRRELHFAFDVDEESVDDSFTGTASQALMLLNGALTQASSTALSGSTLGRARAQEDRAAIETLYLAAYARPPDADELAHWREYLRSAKSADPSKLEGPMRRAFRSHALTDRTPRDAALEDIFWALLVSSEFFFIH